jgi:chromosome segregation ATPase
VPKYPYEVPLLNLLLVSHYARHVLQEKKAAHAETEQEARRVQAAFANTKKLAAEKKAMAEEKAPLVDGDGNDTELKRQIQEIGFDTVNELQVAYEEAMARANDITDDPNAIRHYEQRKRDIEQLETELERREHQEATKAVRIQEMAEKWEGGLAKHIARVNKLFMQYMSEMDCVGEILLSKGKENASTYKNWGIQILVSFRGEAKVQALSAERNSGGERSVCTIMYLMALQEMMVAPFRCVDEINQGLDERNERLVFKRIVANSCRAPSRKDTSDHSGQYFLITPKLLPNLTDMEHEAVSVLFVMNGKCLEMAMMKMHGLIGI